MSPSSKLKKYDKKPGGQCDTTHIHVYLRPAKVKYNLAFTALHRIALQSEIAE